MYKVKRINNILVFLLVLVFFVPFYPYDVFARRTKEYSLPITIEDAKEIFSHYDLGGIIDVSNLKKGGQQNISTLVTTSEGTFVLSSHRWRNSPDLLLWECTFREGIRANGSNLPPRIYKTKDGGYFVDYEGSLYTVDEYIEGKLGEWWQLPEEQLINTAYAVAEFWDASKDVEPEGRNVRNSERGYFLIDFTDLNSLREKFREVCDNLDNLPGGDSQVAQFIIKHFDFLMEQIDNLKQASERTYEVLTQGYVHGDITPRNILYDEGNRPIAFVDYDFVHWDALVVDVACSIVQIDWREDALDLSNLKQYITSIEEKWSRRFTEDDLGFLTEVYRAWFLEGFSAGLGYIEGKFKVENDLWVKILEDNVYQMQVLDSPKWRDALGNLVRGIRP